MGRKLNNFFNIASFIGILLIIAGKVYLHDDIFGWIIAALLSLYITVKEY